MAGQVCRTEIVSQNRRPGDGETNMMDAGLSVLEKNHRNCNRIYLSPSRLGKEFSWLQAMREKFFWSSLQA